MLCKVKADVLRYPISNTFDPKSIILVDYKTTQSVEPKAFVNSVKKYQYDVGELKFHEHMKKKSNIEILVSCLDLPVFFGDICNSSKK